MEWISKKPTEEGWYWIKEFKDSIGSVVEVYDNGDGLSAAGFGAVENMYHTTLWSAKLEPPNIQAEER